jgi:hypothetical protein
MSTNFVNYCSGPEVRTLVVKILSFFCKFRNHHDMENFTENHGELGFSKERKIWCVSHDPQ